MKTKLITLLCVLMSISFCFAQSKDEIEMIKVIKQEGNVVPSSLMEEPRAFLHQPWLSVSMPENREAVISVLHQTSGTVVYQQAYFHTQSVTVDLGGMPVGTYQLQIEIDGTVYTGTFRL